METKNVTQSDIRVEVKPSVDELISVATINLKNLKVALSLNSSTKESLKTVVENTERAIKALPENLQKDFLFPFSDLRQQADRKFS